MSAGRFGQMWTAALINGSTSSPFTVCASGWPGEAEGEGLARLLRHIERAEHPVPQRKARTEVLVEVLRIGRVMHLMMRGADEDAPEHAAERNPHVRMLEMHIGVNKQHQDQEPMSYRRVKIGLGVPGRGCFERVLHVESFRGRPQAGARNRERRTQAMSGFRVRSLCSRSGMTRYRTRKETSCAGRRIPDACRYWPWQRGTAG